MGNMAAMAFVEFRSLRSESVHRFFQIGIRNHALIIQGVPKKPKTIEINVLLELECLSTLLNPHVHQRLT
jgi:hypothetical protein